MTWCPSRDNARTRSLPIYPELPVTRKRISDRRFRSVKLQQLARKVVDVRERSQEVAPEARVSSRVLDRPSVIATGDTRPYGARWCVEPVEDHHPREGKTPG